MELNDNSTLIAVFTHDGFYLDYDSQRKKKNLNQDLQKKLYNAYTDDPDRMVYSIGFDASPTGLSESLEFLYDLSRGFVFELFRKTEIELLTDSLEFDIADDVIENLLLKLPYVIGIENISSDWIRMLFNRLYAVFHKEIEAYPGSVADYLSERNDTLTLPGRVYFHLVENKEDESPFAFLATYSKAKKGGRKAVHTPLKNALIEFENDQDKLLSLLSTVSKVVNSSAFISEIVESGELFKPLRFTADEAHTFLKETPLYERNGIICRIPNWWKRKSISAKVTLKIGEEKPSKVGLDSLMSFDPHLSLGGGDISLEELNKLLGLAEGLKLIKGNWIEIDHKKLKDTIEAYEKAQELASDGFMTMAEAMRLQLEIKDRLELDDEISIEVQRGQWLNQTLQQLRDPKSISSISTSENFKAELRHYQKDGLKWLRMMGNCGFGACLADDMGLGKTIQVIALLDVIKTNGKANALLVLPASLMGNWQKEIEHFGPAIHYKLIYSKKDMIPVEELDSYDLIITTYGMVSRIEEFQSKHWNLMILDEAQAIKNPSTKQTKSVKKIHASNRIALTGTPIENNLTDLWSLFDFLNTGLLGSIKEFKGFIKQLNEQHADYSKLKDMISPFILRRLKSDKTVISELPDKVEIKKYSNLSKKQVVLYNNELKRLAKLIETSDGMARRGLVLGSISKFKQICNHPDHFLGSGDFKVSHSGKYEVLEEICQTIYEKRERMLIFTQFREMTGPLSDFLESIFHRQGLVIHGGTPVKKRSEIVAKFQSDEYIPFMVLSLKAGGVGLNLTAANHVVHFDRWWNPAIENQATDRAFRIGQNKNVMVHKFIAKGTIEEKIDEMIDEKTALSNDIIGSEGPKWITELDNNELLDLFSLSVANESRPI